MSLTCKLTAKGYDTDVLARSVSTILSENRLCSMASLMGNTPYINTAYFAYSDDLTIHILTEPTTQHSRNVENNKVVALSIFDDKQPFGSNLKGLQIFGACQLAVDNAARRAFESYGARFPELQKWVSTFDAYTNGTINSRFYSIIVNRLKLFDEPSFGKEVWIDAAVLR